MATIVYHVPAEYGHFAASLFLSRQLVAAGHRVVYISELDLQDAIEKEGFAYTPYLTTVYPKGAVRARYALEGEAAWEWWFERDVARFEEARSGRFEATLSALAPDLIISDYINPETSLVAHKMRVPFVRCNTMLPAYYQADVPPMWSDALPGELARWELESEWMCHDVLYNIHPWLEKPHRIPQRDFYAYVEACGLSVAQIVLRSAFNFHVEGDPEIVTCAQAFDFPTPDVPDRVYMGPCLDDVAGDAWTYPGRRPGAPLIYCGFGSMASSYPKANVALDQLIEVARRRPDLDVVISIPDDMARARQLPPTVYTQSWLPQRQVLREADVFITHAGLASCREAIWEGVPMLAIPCWADQRGLAARIVYHELGERMHRDIHADAMARLIDGLLVDPKYRRAAERMQGEFRGCDRTRGLDFVTSVMDGRFQPRSPDYYAGVMRKIYREIMGDD